MAGRDLISFADFYVDPANECVRRGAEIVALTPKAFAVLCYLVEHRGRLVSKDELLQALWPETVVGEAALTVCIGAIRRALGDEAQRPRFIETVHGRGYRFIAPVAAAAAPVPSSTLQVPRADTQDSAPCFGGSRDRTLTTPRLVRQSPGR
jgi:DNA-binding winged helix-turn-helix (wHTH) protein